MAARLQGVEALTMEPLTDQELDDIESGCRAYHTYCDHEGVDPVLRLVAEVRRLRAAAPCERCGMNPAAICTGCHTITGGR